MKKKEFVDNKESFLSKNDLSKQEQSLKVSIVDFQRIELIENFGYKKFYKVRKRGTVKFYTMRIFRKENDDQSFVISESEEMSISHPYVIKFHYFFRRESKRAFIYDYLPGGNLRMLLRDRKKLSVKEVKFYVSEMVLAIEYLHSKDYVLGTIKPEDIGFSDEGHAILKTDGNKKDKEDPWNGAHEYLAPEILLGNDKSKEVDWWSLGIILYEMLTGLPLFYSENIVELYTLILNGDIKFLNDLPKDAKDLIEKLLKRDPKKRIGYGRIDGSEIRAHNFFQDVNWDKLMKKKIKPPVFISKKKDEYLRYEKQLEDRLIKAVENIS